MTTPHTRSDEALEAALDVMLRELPPRRAPASLSARVQARLAHCPSNGPQLSSFRSWSLAVRAAFCVASLGIAALAIEGSAWLFAAFDSQALWMSATHAWSLWQTVGVLSTSVARAIPLSWLYATAGIIAALYLAFFGLGAAAYRTLYQRPFRL